MIGVCIFSTLMDTFLEIITGLKELNADLDDGDRLTGFMNLLARFNGGKPIKKSFVAKVEMFMDYKWKHDRLLALKSE